MIAKVQVANLIWQPSFSCRNKKCKQDCYVARSTLKTYNEKKQRQLLSLICSGELEIENELILSLDAPPKKGEKSDSTSLITDIIICSKYINKLHLAADNIQTILYWTKKAKVSLDKIGKISVSSLKNIRKYEDDIAYLNYNLLASKYNKEVEERIIGNKDIIKSIHLILHKYGMEDGCYHSSYDQLLSVLRRLMLDGIFPPSNIEVDQCYLHRERNTVCGAAIDRIHVWPDGTVTGCPYDYKGRLGFNESNILNSLIKIMYTERQTIPHNVCNVVAKEIREGNI